MPDLGSLKSSIDAIFAESESRCLWFSGGSDSRLLLEVMLETKQTFGILKFDEGWSREQRKQFDAVVVEKNLQVFSYPAVSNTLVGDNGDLGLVSQYAIDGFGNTVMLIRDLVDDPKTCAFDIKLEPAKLKIAPIEYDVHLMGLKRSDRHWLRAKKPLIENKERNIGDKQFLFPLSGWSHKKVREVLKSEYGVDLSGDLELADINCCHNCLKTTERVFCPKQGEEIDGILWNRQENTELVREILGK